MSGFDQRMARAGVTIDRMVEERREFKAKLVHAQGRWKAALQRVEASTNEVCRVRRELRGWPWFVLLVLVFILGTLV